MRARDHLLDVASSRHTTSPARADKGILRIVVCIAVAASPVSVVRAQDAVLKVLPEPTILPELSKRTEPQPIKVEATATPDTEKPSIEILAGTPSEKPAPIVEQTPPPETGAILTAPVEKKTRPAKHMIVQPKAPEPSPPIELKLSALRAVATSAPLPDYPYEAKKARATGSGVCILVVDSTDGRVTSATMAQSTGSQILDAVTINTFRRWRFKPGTVSQLKVPITYE